MIKQQSNEISVKRSKLQHQAELLESYFDASTMLCESRIADRKGKIALQFSTCAQKHGNSTQQQNPILIIWK